MAEAIVQTGEIQPVHFLKMLLQDRDRLLEESYQKDQEIFALKSRLAVFARIIESLQQPAKVIT